MAISKQFEVHHSTERKFIHKWYTFKTDTNSPRSGRLSKFTLRSDCVTFREMADNPRTTMQTLRASANMLNDKDHDSTITKICLFYLKKHVSMV